MHTLMMAERHAPPPPSSVEATRSPLPSPPSLMHPPPSSRPAHTASPLRITNVTKTPTSVEFRLAGQLDNVKTLLDTMSASSDLTAALPGDEVCELPPRLACLKAEGPGVGTGVGTGGCRPAC